MTEFRRTAQSGCVRLRMDCSSRGRVRREAKTQVGSEWTEEGKLCLGWQKDKGHSIATRVSLAGAEHGHSHKGGRRTHNDREVCRMKV